MRSERVLRSDSPENKSDAAAAGVGVRPGSVEFTASWHDRIAEHAYEIARRRGFEPGHELDDWLRAEREIEAGAPRNTPPDAPFGDVRTFSNE